MPKKNTQENLANTIEDKKPAFFKKVGFVSLGCDKNRVDTEKMLAQINKRHQIVANIEDAQILIVNTCAFLNTDSIAR